MASIARIGIESWSPRFLQLGFETLGNARKADLSALRQCGADGRARAGGSPW